MSNKALKDFVVQHSTRMNLNRLPDPDAWLNASEDDIHSLALEYNNSFSHRYRALIQSLSFGVFFSACVLSGALGLGYTLQSLLTPDNLLLIGLQLGVLSCAGIIFGGIFSYFVKTLLFTDTDKIRKNLALLSSDEKLCVEALRLIDESADARGYRNDRLAKGLTLRVLDLKQMKNLVRNQKAREARVRLYALNEKLHDPDSVPGPFRPRQPST